MTTPIYFMVGITKQNEVGIGSFPGGSRKAQEVAARWHFKKYLGYFDTAEQADNWAAAACMQFRLRREGLRSV